MSCAAFGNLHMQNCYPCALMKMILHSIYFMCACWYISDALRYCVGDSLRTAQYSESSSIITRSSALKDIFIARYF